MKAVLALLCVAIVAVVAVGACSSGAAIRGTTSAAVKTTLKVNNINYRGDVTCRGNHVPIICTSTATDGRPISATLTRSGGDCILAVRVGDAQISRDKAVCS